MTEETQRRVEDLLHKMPSHGLSAAKQLFCTELNYDHANVSLSSRDWPNRARDTLAEAPTILARHESQYGIFDIVYAKLSSERRGRSFPLSLTSERLTINQFLKNHPYALFIFSDIEKRHLHLVNVRYDEDVTRRRVFRRIALDPDERLRTTSEENRPRGSGRSLRARAVSCLAVCREQSRLRLRQGPHSSGTCAIRTT